MDKIGIIAGNGQFPRLIARAARAEGMQVVAVALEGEADPALEQAVDSLTWIKLGQLGKLIKTFKAAGVKQLVMSGGVNKARLFHNIRPDFKLITVLPRFKNMADDGILRILAQVMEDEGLIIRPSHILLPGLLAAPGLYTKRAPSQRERIDMDLGWDIFNSWGRLDIGQALVLKNKVVVAVEAVEGTDACILRGGQLVSSGTVVVKRCKINQDERFDLPSVGTGTIAAMVQAGAVCLCIEAGRTLVFDKEEMIKAANEQGICIIARSQV
jgi:DUF1009 family protein